MCICVCTNLAVMHVRLGYLFRTRVWMFYRENRCKATLGSLCLSRLCGFVLVRQTESDTRAFTAVQVLTELHSFFCIDNTVLNVKKKWWLVDFRKMCMSVLGVDRQWLRNMDVLCRDWNGGRDGGRLKEGGRQIGSEGGLCTRRISMALQSCRQTR